MTLQNGDDDPLHNIAAFNKAVQELCQVYEQLFGEPLNVSGQSSYARFCSCKVKFWEKFRNLSDERKKSVEEALDLDLKNKSLEDALDNLASKLADPLTVSDVDDLPANWFKAAATEVAGKRGRAGEIVRVPLNEFLRDAVRLVFTSRKLTGSLNVGPNRHFPRLHQWMQEMAEASDWDGGQGFKIGNINGAGPVAAYPTDPKKLRVSINLDYI